MNQKIFTNCFLLKRDKNEVPTHVCLAMKKRGFGKGLWNGSGGKPQENETVENTAIREVEEELQVNVTKLVKCGEISFVLKQENKEVLMHVFLVTSWKNEPVETEEMKPQWFKIDKVPYDKMWKSDKEWLPIILSGKKIKAKYTYAHEGGIVETRELNEMESFN